MPEFLSPEIPEGFTVAHLSLKIIGAGCFPATRLVEVSEAIAAESRHRVYRFPLRVSGSDAEGRLLLGVHAADEHDEDEGSDSVGAEYHLHYTLDLDMRTRLGESPEDTGSAMLSLLPEIVGEHEADVTMMLMLRGAKPVVALPIPLSERETPGFSAIRGVRLVKEDPANNEEVLYSVVVEQFPDVLSVMVAVPLTTTWSERLIADAVERAFSVVVLSIQRPVTVESA